MNYKPQDIKNILLSIIDRQKENLIGLVSNPQRDFYKPYRQF